MSDKLYEALKKANANKGEVVKKEVVEEVIEGVGDSNSNKRKPTRVNPASNSSTPSTPSSETPLTTSSTGGSRTPLTINSDAKDSGLRIPGRNNHPIDRKSTGMGAPSADVSKEANSMDEVNNNVAQGVPQAPSRAKNPEGKNNVLGNKGTSPTSFNTVADMAKNNMNNIPQSNTSNGMQNFSGGRNGREERNQKRISAKQEKKDRKKEAKKKKKEARKQKRKDDFHKYGILGTIKRWIKKIKRWLIGITIGLILLALFIIIFWTTILNVLQSIMDWIDIDFGTKWSLFWSGNVNVTDEEVEEFEKELEAMGIDTKSMGFVDETREPSDKYEYLRKIMAADLLTYYSKGTSIFGKEYGTIDIKGDIDGIFDSNTSKIDTTNKTLTLTTNTSIFSGLADWIGIKNGRVSATFNLEGWTGRYGMPKEFLIALHLATMAPDFVEKVIDEIQPNTLIEMKLYDMNFERKVYKYLPNGTWDETAEEEENYYSKTDGDLKLLMPYITRAVTWYKEIKFDDCYEFGTNAKQVKYCLYDENTETSEELPESVSGDSTEIKDNEIPEYGGIAQMDSQILNIIRNHYSRNVDDVGEWEEGFHVGWDEEDVQNTIDIYYDSFGDMTDLYPVCEYGADGKYYARCISEDCGIIEGTAHDRTQITKQKISIGGDMGTYWYRCATCGGVVENTNKYVFKEILTGSITQTKEPEVTIIPEEGITGMSTTFKKLFRDGEYAIYDGTVMDYNDRPRRKFIETYIDEDGNEQAIANVPSTITLAFSILENTNTTDAQIILRDLKEFLSEEGYYFSTSVFDNLSSKSSFLWIMPQCYPLNWPSSADIVNGNDNIINATNFKNEDGTPKADDELTVISPASAKVVDMNNDTIALRFTSGVNKDMTMIISGIKVASNLMVDTSNLGNYSENINKLIQLDIKNLSNSYTANDISGNINSTGTSIVKLGDTIGKADPDKNITIRLLNQNGTRVLPSDYIRALDPNYEYVQSADGHAYPILKQSDKQWGSKRFLHSCSGSCIANHGFSATIATHGCGPSSMAMLISGLTGKVITPFEYSELLGTSNKACSGSGFGVSTNKILETKFGIATKGPFDGRYW